MKKGMLFIERNDEGTRKTDVSREIMSLRLLVTSAAFHVCSRAASQPASPLHVTEF